MTSDAFVNSQDWKHVVISNPPYISPQKLRAETERSVRIFEPRGALVAQSSEDGSLTQYEDVMYRFINQKKVGLSLLEFVDEDRARLYMQKIIELLRPDTSKPEPAPGSFRTLLLQAWRDSSETNSRSKPFAPINESYAFHRLAANDEEDGAMHAVVAFNGVMPNSMLIPYNFSCWCRWFFRGGSPSPKKVREKNAKKAKMVEAKKMELKEKRGKQERQKESESCAATDQSDSHSQEDVAPSQHPSAMSDPEFASQTAEGLVEALNGVAELRRAAKQQLALHRELLAERKKVQDLCRVVQRHERLQRELLQQQTAIWDSLSELACHVNRQSSEPKRDLQMETLAAMITPDGPEELVVTQALSEPGATENIQTPTEDAYP